MSNPVRRSAPPIAGADLDAFEQSLGHALPAEYRKFLLATNGGFPRRVEFRYDLAPGKSRRGRVLGFSPLA